MQKKKLARIGKWAERRFNPRILEQKFQMNARECNALMQKMNAQIIQTNKWIN